MPTTRAMYMSPGSVWMTLPKTTCSTSAGWTSARSMAARAVVAPSSLGGTSFSDFPYPPTAVRTAEVMTTPVDMARECTVAA